jgi:hypothetical protein
MIVPIGDSEATTYIRGVCGLPATRWEGASGASLRSREGLPGLTVDPERFAAFSGTRSLPLAAGEPKRIAVKLIDRRGHELMRVMGLGDGTRTAEAKG